MSAERLKDQLYIESNDIYGEIEILRGSFFCLFVFWNAIKICSLEVCRRMGECSSSKCLHWTVHIAWRKELSYITPWCLATSTDQILLEDFLQKPTHVTPQINNAPSLRFADLHHLFYCCKSQPAVKEYLSKVNALHMVYNWKGNGTWEDF